MLCAAGGDRAGQPRLAVIFIRDKKVLCSFQPDGHHGQHGMSIWAPAPPGVQEQLVDDEPERFYRPPYVGGKG